MHEYFKTFARYNTWANERLYAACLLLTPEDYFLDRKAFFTSIHGTLNHLLVADKIWLGRWQVVDSGMTSLNQILYEDFNSLFHARKIEDQKLIDFVDSLDPKQLEGSLTYTNMAGQSLTRPWTYMLGHLFNHQTHHRGQVHNMLSQAGQEPPVLDFHYFVQTI
jgi:uncharacterized damage-inducible protein DinB